MNKKGAKKTMYFGSKERERKKKLKERNNYLSIEEQDQQINEYIKKHGVKKIPAARAEGSFEAISLGLDL